LFIELPEIKVALSSNLKKIQKLQYMPYKKEFYKRKTHHLKKIESLKTIPEGFLGFNPHSLMSKPVK
jgi:hypothetical protein